MAAAQPSLSAMARLTEGKGPLGNNRIVCAGACPIRVRISGVRRRYSPSPRGRGLGEGPVQGTHAPTPPPTPLPQGTLKGRGVPEIKAPTGNSPGRRLERKNLRQFVAIFDVLPRSPSSRRRWASPGDRTSLRPLYPCCTSDASPVRTVGVRTRRLRRPSQPGLQVDGLRLPSSATLAT